jgi:DNA-binding CsgD family transcriptional regulator
MANSDQLGGIIQNIYSTAMNADSWPSLLQQVGDHFHSGFAANMVQSGKTGYGQRHYVYGIDDRVMSDYEEYYGPRSTLFDQFRDLEVGRVFTDYMSPDFEQYLKSETYNDYCRANAVEHALSLFSDRSSDWVDVLVLRRGKHKGHYTAEEVTAMQMLAPHFVQASIMGKQMQHRNALGSAYEDVFNHLSVGVIILNNLDETLFINQRADEILSASDGLSLRSGSLVAATGGDDTRLQQAKQNVFDIVSGKTLHSSSPILIKRRDKKPYQLAFMPLSNDSLPFASGSGLVLVTIYDAEQEAVSSLEVLCALYGLTVTEGMVTQAICNGLSVKLVAEHIGVSENGIRFHLKNIFQKLHVKRQTEMVRMILTGPAALLGGLNLSGKRNVCRN